MTKIIQNNFLSPKLSHLAEARNFNRSSTMEKQKDKLKAYFQIACPKTDNMQLLQKIKHYVCKNIPNL